ncbi:hypothetical protein GGQ80_000775 [Sphingomonas jinjuensis]|uniref:Uncharacterized protein n=1 Tax=Sphingomonas jinjuensis TaxID=535907 RepID=A0A840FBH4_9SPHN|nr:hypothetical protein [Sphingomonas jinjuensis]MBB4152887.1 hypothetical protein [Sphingomonas jinjuensis]
MATAGEPRAPSWRDFTPTIALIVTIAGIIYACGGTLSQVAINARDIAELKMRVDERDRQMQDLQVRMARIDGKLDLLLERSRKAGQ